MKNFSPWLALLAGSILPLAFSPFGIYSLAFISPAALCYLWIKSTSKQAAWCGFYFGLGFFGVGMSWISISIHNFGNVSIWLTWLVTIGFSAFLSLFFVLQGYLFQRITARKSLIIQCLCAFPALWLFSEYLRSTLLTGLPWLLLGYSQTASFLQGFAPIIGTYGLSLCVTLVSGSLILCILSRSLTDRLIALCVLFIILIPAWLLYGQVWTKPIGKTFKTTLVQGNFDQFLKWDAHTLQTILDTYLQLSEENVDSQLIVWPEAAIPYYPSQLVSYIDIINQLGIDNNITFLVGAPTFDKTTKRYFNSLLMLGEQKKQYNKHHLVPFGEYTPWDSVINRFLASFSIPMSNFSAGGAQQGILSNGDLKIAPFICYEIIYPQYVIRHSQLSDILVVINDDGWFGGSIALAQHLQMAQMAALETNRYVLFCSNTGITAIIDPLGKVSKTAPINTRTVVSGNVHSMSENTPLMSSGYWPIAITTVILMLMSLL